ncbi:putative zinc-type alcohol dehydrogenase-like protein YogA [Mycolicibacterium chitae]|uniref:Zn-dependent oxidoreductase, NADPH:quinone reductase n=1 Tax=Mycolicibacterium chitae TaxID=1792 RepID=A0A448I9E7_MYCCI|nr:zinc-binding dehydrogenase [Mycolicibacterium chitae]MCV7104483.1 zinc-binding dehydrogenase [Mycolicibacterium chitae]BBZ05450.1 putative zinc-type alcohol dehydrogenase-like protein YogA [Mycolicibacterium chitae]VEG49066.1 Zn-dependent oxidoreductase, NADPH:quinone reductase [Mycolicibacterium chitae]
MRAAVLRNWGAPDELRVESVPDPTPCDGEALVELRAAALNWHDVIVRQTGRGAQLPSILGMDGAGVRRDTGEEVVIYPGLNWGDKAAGPGPGFGVLGDADDGTYAELIAVPEAMLYPKPAHLSWLEAAALPCAALTAFRAVFTRAGLQPGETVLVLGAGSGVSTFAVLFAAASGAEVYVTSSSTAKIDSVRGLGARGGVLYTEPGWPAAVAESTGGGVDVIVCGVGSELADALSCLKTGGRIALFGARAGQAVGFDAATLYFRQASILGTTLGSPDDFARMLEFVTAHELRPVVDRVYPLDEIAAAHTYLETGGQLGKVVIDITA